MQVLFGGYSRWWNRRNERSGHLHHNRCFVTEPLDNDHFRVAAAYVDLNPVRAGIVTEPEHWRWSSYRAHVGLEPPIPLLANDEFLRSWGPVAGIAMATYRRYVRSWQLATLLDRREVA